MRSTARLYHTIKEDFLVIYDSSTKLSFNSTLVAYATYQFGSKTRNVSVFRFSGIIDPSKGYNVLETIDTRLASRSLSPTVDADYNINIQVKPDCEVVADAIRWDIQRFAGNRHAPTPGKNSLKLIDRLQPEVVIDVIPKKYLLTGGKQVYVRPCIANANFDLTVGFCINSCIPNRRLRDVSLEDGILKGASYVFQNRCRKCYSSWKARAWKLIVDFTVEHMVRELRGDCYLEGPPRNKEEIETKRYGRLVQYLRLGKDSELGHPATLGELRKVLIAANEAPSKVIFPNTLLHFDRDFAGLMIANKGALAFSIGDNKYEVGACKNDATNQQRMERAARYKQAGVENTELWVGFNAPVEFGRREEKIIRFAEREGLLAIFFGMRLPDRQFALDYTGHTWEELKGQTSIRKSKNSVVWGTYFVTGSNMLAPRVIHPSTLRLIGNNNGPVRLCHHAELEDGINQKVYCAGCGLRKGIIVTEKIPEIDYKKRRDNDKDKKTLKRRRKRTPLFGLT